MHLWQTIVSNRLLQNTSIILFLNKIDLMQQKLASGIRLRDYVVSYGDRPNNYETASACAWVVCSRVAGAHMSSPLADLKKKFGEGNPVGVLVDRMLTECP